MLDIEKLREELTDLREEVKELRSRKKDLYQLGDFTLNSGAKSRAKIECDALSDGSIEALAWMIQHMVGRFQAAKGVPRGGLRLASALLKYATPGTGAFCLIVDDVLTTGGSMERTKQAFLDRERSMLFPCGPLDVVGAVIYARGPCPTWVKAVHQLPECLWLSQLPK